MRHVTSTVSTTATTTPQALTVAPINLAGHTTSEIPWFFWLVLAICLVLFGLTVGSICVGRKKARRKKVLDGQENLLDVLQ